MTGSSNRGDRHRRSGAGRLAGAALLCLAPALASCPSSSAKQKQERRTVAISSAPVPVPAIEPLIDFRDLDSLPVPNYGNAVVWVPVGTTQPRGIVLGVHGNSDPPEALCSAIHDIVRTRAFVLCVRGFRKDYTSQDLTFTSPQHLALEVDAAIRALDKRYPGYVDRQSVMYVGFSRGAYLSVPIIATEPARFSRAILIEGGQDAWTRDRVKMFGAEGGKRILWACGQEDCMLDAKAVGAKLEEVGVQVRIAYRADAGHTYTGQVLEELQRNFEWVVQGDPRWR